MVRRDSNMNLKALYHNVLLSARTLSLSLCRSPSFVLSLSLQVRLSLFLSLSHSFFIGSLFKTRPPGDSDCLAQRSCRPGQSTSQNKTRPPTLYAPPGPRPAAQGIELTPRRGIVRVQAGSMTSRRSGGQPMLPDPSKSDDAGRSARSTARLR